MQEVDSSDHIDITFKSPTNKVSTLSPTDVLVAVDGMTCMSCVRNIEGTVSQIQGVMSISVSLENKLAKLVIDERQISPQAAAEAIDDMRFEAKLISPLPKSKSKQNAGIELATTHISIEGMTCQSCVRNIEGNISKKPGVMSINVSLANKSAVVTYVPSETDPDAIASQIDDLGFEAAVAAKPHGDSNSSSLSAFSMCKISVIGMTCHSCVRNIESNIGAKDGIVTIVVSLERNMATVTYDPSVLMPKQIADMIDDMGFEASVLGDSENTEKAVIGIVGMTCNSCVKNIEQTVGQNKAVKSIKILLDEKTGTIEYNPKQIDPQGLCQLVDDMGFEASYPGK